MGKQLRCGASNGTKVHESRDKSKYKTMHKLPCNYTRSMYFPSILHTILIPSLSRFFQKPLTTTTEDYNFYSEEVSLKAE